MPRATGASGRRTTVSRMDARTPEPFVHVSDPSYGPGFDPTDSETAPVDTSVEGIPWGPVVPRAAEGGELVFIDGAQQVEAWLTISAGDDPEARPGAAFAVAAGAVLCAPGQRGRDRRPAGARGDRDGGRPPARPCRRRAGFSLGAARRGRQRGHRHRPPGRRVPPGRWSWRWPRSWRAPDRLVVLDGRLSFVRDVGGPVVGAIKSHHRMYLPPDEARTRGRAAAWASARRCSRSARTASAGTSAFRAWAARAGRASCAARSPRSAGHRRGGAAGRPGRRRAAPVRRAAAPRPARAAEPVADRRARGAPAPPDGRPPPGAAGGAARRARGPASTPAPRRAVAVAEAVDAVAA